MQIPDKRNFTSQLHYVMKKIKAEVINIGDEILIGQIVNTNAVWIAEQFNFLGIPISRMTTVGDTREAILKSVDDALKDHDIIIITGGLGPTKDDLTKHVLAEYFESEMRFDEAVFNLLDTFFKSRGRTMSEANKTQCYVPEKCTVLMNYWGTAPGMLFEKNGKYIVSLPGVPVEMKEIITHAFIPFIREKFSLSPLVHRSYITEGIPESELMVTIGEWEDHLPPSIKLAYLPSAGQVKLRMSSLNEDGKANELMDAEEKKLLQLIGDEIFGRENETLEEVIKKLLVEKNQTITTAESCTGGYIAHKLTSVPGISKAYPGSVITYDYWVKTALLGVKEETLEKFGAVSKETVIEMAEGVKKLMKTDYAISVSGIAGPDGGTDEKPVGTVWVAWATGKGTFTKRFRFGKDRNINIHRTYQASLNVLRKLILDIPLKEGFWE